jgi:four helix bundle protein
MRRAAVSVASNIVEGCARKSQVEYLRFIEIAFGSLRELHYQTELAFRLEFIDKSIFSKINEQLNETEMVFTGLMKSLG